MKKLFLEKNETYTGEQLKPLQNYLKHGLLGNSIVCWVGPCQVKLEHMIDGEDLRSHAKIEGHEMLHFVLELFDIDLKTGIVLQRLMAEIVKSTLIKISGNDALKILRNGDDLYLENKKLNISIATKSTNSVLIHFGINVTNDGTPVPTCSLSDFKIDSKKFAEQFIEQVDSEFKDIVCASQKVRTF